jgi:hypothetical protein
VLTAIARVVWQARRRDWLFYAPSAEPRLSTGCLMHLILFQRDDCQLCDEALALLAQVRAPEFESVFIDEDAALEARYGTRVPVLRDARDGCELDWPFDAGHLRAWLQDSHQRAR